MNCKLIADVLVLHSDKVLMVRYKNVNNYDHQSGWFLPDDALREFEHPEDAAIRILEEQMNLHDVMLTLDHIESFKGNDKSWHLVFHFKTILSSETEIKISEDIEEYKWFDLNDLPDRKEVAHNGWALYTILTATQKS